MSKRFQQWLIISDVHVPWHSKPLIRKLCKLAHDVKFDGFIINGDFLDLYTLSRHNAGSLGLLKDLTLTQEYVEGNKVLDDLMSTPLRRADKRYLFGNHEDNYRRCLLQDDNAKFGESLRGPLEALSLSERGFQVLQNWKDDSVRLGSHLDVTHGVNCCVHVAAKALSEFEGSVIVGHTHRFNTFVTGRRAAFNVGFLGDRASSGFHYMPAKDRRKWTNSFATVNILDDGDFLANPIQCWNDRFIFNGKLY